MIQLNIHQNPVSPIIEFLLLLKMFPIKSLDSLTSVSLNDLSGSIESTFLYIKKEILI